MKIEKKQPLNVSRCIWTLISLSLLSCNDDNYITNHPEESSQTISFAISEAETRATNPQFTTVQLILREANTTDTLCVQTSISDTINSLALAHTPATRAEPITDIATAYGSFGVFAYAYTGGETLPSYYIYNEKTTSTAGTWTSVNTYYWPGINHTLRFYAYTPYNSDAITLPAPTSPHAAPTVSYLVPDAVADQQDVLVATTEKMAGNSNTRVPLTFKHICTAVRFVTGDDIQSGTITKITLKGIYKSGTYSMNEHTWNSPGSVSDFTQEPNADTDGTAGAEITTNEATFMMIPQTLSANAAIEVVFYDDLTQTERTLTGTIAGTEWPIGKTVTYKISISPS